MDARSTDYEIVHVISDFRLLDEECYERVYWRRDGKPLSRGFYVVTWVPGTLRRKFDESAEFDGPFRLEDDARFAARRQFGVPGKLAPAAEHSVGNLAYMPSALRQREEGDGTHAARARASRPLRP
jgi:hypothetical protein